MPRGGTVSEVSNLLWHPVRIGEQDRGVSPEGRRFDWAVYDESGWPVCVINVGGNEGRQIALEISDAHDGPILSAIPGPTERMERLERSRQTLRVLGHNVPEGPE